MTTVAYDGRYLATDTRATNIPDRSPVLGDRYKCAHCENPIHAVHDNSIKLKVFGKKGGFVYEEQPIEAMAVWGSQTATSYMGSLLQSKHHLDEHLSYASRLKPQVSGGLLLVSEKKIFILTWNGVTFKTKAHERQVHHAYGSGAGAARLMMKMGEGMAPTAVAAAAMIDKGTGGKILVLDTWADDANYKSHSHDMRTATQVKLSLCEVLNQSLFPKEIHAQPTKKLPARPAHSA